MDGVIIIFLHSHSKPTKYYSFIVHCVKLMYSIHLEGVLLIFNIHNRSMIGQFNSYQKGIFECNSLLLALFIFSYSDQSC